MVVAGTKGCGALTNPEEMVLAGHNVRVRNQYGGNGCSWLQDSGAQNQQEEVVVGGPKMAEH